MPIPFIAPPQDRSRPVIIVPFQKPQRCPAIPELRGKNLEHLAFMVHRTPEVMRLTTDPDKHLVQVPAPSGVRGIMNAALSDLRGKQWIDPVPPQPYGLMADVDTALEQQSSTCISDNG